MFFFNVLHAQIWSQNKYMLMWEKKLTEESEHTKGELYKINLYMVYFCVLILLLS